MTEKLFMRATARIMSPLSVSNGEDDVTDRDIIRDFDGNPFIPGASIAGAMRGYLADRKIRDALFGFVERTESVEPKTTSRQSLLYVYDADIAVEKRYIAIRDGVRLTAERVAYETGKFDYEIIENGVVTMRFELTQSDGEPELQVIKLLEAVNGGEIRFGSKKNRGNGRLWIEEVKACRYRKGEAYYTFDWALLDSSSAERIGLVDSADSQYVTMTIPLCLDGSINIRQYTALKSEADSRHIRRAVTASAGIDGREDGKAVIPGTSWAGAIRHRARRILADLGVSDQNADEKIDFIFGDTQSHASRVAISESILQDSVAVPVSRIKISRFDAAVMGGALFTEIVACGGKCNLEVKIAKCDATPRIMGLLAFVVMDIQHGFLAVGGEAAIGRGIFTVDESVNIYERYKSEIDAFSRSIKEAEVQ